MWSTRRATRMYRPRKGRHFTSLSTDEGALVARSGIYKTESCLIGHRLGGARVLSGCALNLKQSIFPTAILKIMFQIKICGITSRDDAQHAASAGADAIGLNFFDRSPRYVTVSRADEIVADLPGDISKVGVFVNPTLELVEETTRRLQLNYVQLHGDEPPEFLAALRDTPVIRAFRCGDGGFDALDMYLQRCRECGKSPFAVLVDAFSPDQYGGTGRRVDWDAVGKWRDRSRVERLILAGGLSPANVASVIRFVCPNAVDTASGVESSPGVKDLELVRQFVAEAKTAFRRPQQS